MISPSLSSAPRPARRVRILRVSGCLLADLLRLDGRQLVRIKGLPPDARLVNVSDHFSFGSGAFAFHVESEAFSAVEPDSHIPEIELQVESCGIVEKG